MQALAVLFGALFTVAVAVACGRLLAGPAAGEWAADFVRGAAIWSSVVFVICALGVAYPAVFLAAGGVVLFAGRKQGAKPPPAFNANRWWTALFLAIAFCYLALYFFNAMAPEASPDGSAYHLGLVSRYLREHGFHRIAWNMYASLPQGAEMLFLSAFAFGAHSSAALVHLTFLAALVWQVYRYALREGFPVAGAGAALVVLASPVVGRDGTSAYNDVALAAAAFTLFETMQRWDRERGTRWLVALGILAGFCYGVKYTAGLAVPYALAFVAWKSRRVRPVAVVALCAAVMIAPWMLKNWLWVHNPVSPFFNQWFPNAYVTPAFEREYAQYFALYNLKSRWQIPWEVTVHGSLSSLLGPVLLLAPIALLALRVRQGRHLLLAATVFGAFYFSNIGTRFLIPALPLVAMAMMLALARTPAVLGVALLHAAISWPAAVPLYSDPGAWRLSSIPWRAALRLLPEPDYLREHLPNYEVARMVERATPPGATIFGFRVPPEAYTTRKLLVAYQSAPNRVAGGILWSAYVPEAAPVQRAWFRFGRQAVAKLRVVAAAAGANLWHIHELRIYDGATVAPRETNWRLTARPWRWGVGDAFDGSPATFWMSGVPIAPGQFVEVDFGRDIQADAVVLESAPDQPAVRLRLDAGDANGAWRTIAATPEFETIPRPPGLRRAATEALRRRGIDYVLAWDGEVGAGDLREHRDEWGIALVAEYGGAHLYQLPAAPPRAIIERCSN